MSKKSLTLMSKDKQLFNIEEHLAVQSVTIRNMVKEDGASSVIPLPRVDSETLALVIEYLNRRKTRTMRRNERGEIPTLLELAKAALDLDIKKLMDAACMKVADLIKDFTLEEVLEALRIENDWTPEEEKAIRDEFQWAF
ncbi:LOW QUALITY PROTEIN: hypothetical protein OSB04_031285 [Centaurea solstitialis]|uniref:SKP1-like protein n=1 Tax=Centaurea solstitialis TaxID=347529 RepID=A0AA38VU57_9ASTR|nr:LOW QUALITY PROTEIN: hypothetical protein OSB04_031285 [Centaurea solstitialis]